jgi:hypothetical protein
MSAAKGDPLRDAAIHRATAELRRASTLEHVLAGLRTAHAALTAPALLCGGQVLLCGGQGEGAAVVVEPQSLESQTGNGSSPSDADGSPSFPEPGALPRDTGFPGRRYGAFVDVMFRQVIPQWGGAFVAAERQSLLDPLFLEVPSDHGLYGLTSAMVPAAVHSYAQRELLRILAAWVQKGGVRKACLVSLLAPALWSHHRSTIVCGAAPCVCVVCVCAVRLLHSDASSRVVCTAGSLSSQPCCFIC